MIVIEVCLLTLCLPKFTLLKNTEYSYAHKQVVALDFQSLFLAKNSNLILEHKAYKLGGLLEV